MFAERDVDNSCHLQWWAGIPVALERVGDLGFIRQTTAAACVVSKARASARVTYGGGVARAAHHIRANK